MESLSALDFSRSDKARLLGLARGIIYFTSSVPFDIISYNCRVGHMPAYSSIYSSLEGLAAQESLDIPARMMFVSMREVTQRSSPSSRFTISIQQYCQN
jgi:hypothetical protein